jgi:uncharacterized protein YegP (UPF0339 family)
MTTATKKSGARGQLAHGARDKSAPESLEFLVFEDNGGDYHWRIDAEDGATLAQSGSYASYEDAGQAVQRVRAGAASARFARRPGEVVQVDGGRQ